MTSREDGGPLMINECVTQGIFVVSTPIGVANDLVIEKPKGFKTTDVGSSAICDPLSAVLDNYTKKRIEMAGMADSQMRRSPLAFKSYIRALTDTIQACLVTGSVL